jgi:NADH-quinone oxidoreductase subunit N
VVTLVRDSGGEQTSLARWAGLGKHSPLVAGVFALLPARDGRHPADAGLRRQVGGLRGRAVGRRLAGRDRGVLSSIVAAYFYVA